MTALRRLPRELVFAYQTDATGVYNVRGARGWRLRGWVKSDAQGGSSSGNIRPGSYPGSRNPAHTPHHHRGSGAAAAMAEEVNFRDDPFVMPERQDGASRTTQAACST